MRVRILVAALALAGGLAGCGDDATTTQPETGNDKAAAAPDASPEAAEATCKVLEKAEVEQALGVSVTMPERYDGICEFAVNDDVKLEVSAVGDAASYNTAKKFALKRVAVPGLGDDAYYFKPKSYPYEYIGVLTGSKNLAVKLTNEGSAPNPVTGDIKTKLIAVANAALPKM